MKKLTIDELNFFKSIKIGDVYLCIKDNNRGFIGNTLINKAGNIYYITDIPDKHKDYFLLTYEPGKPENYGYAYSMENTYSQKNICLFNDYFISLKKIRKEKLEKLKNEKL